MKGILIVFRPIQRCHFYMLLRLVERFEHIEEYTADKSQTSSTSKKRPSDPFFFDFIYGFDSEFQWSYSSLLIRKALDLQKRGQPVVSIA